MSHGYDEPCSPFSLPAVSFPAFLYWLIIWLILRLSMPYRRPFDKVLMFSWWSELHLDLSDRPTSMLKFKIQVFFEIAKLCLSCNSFCILYALLQFALLHVLMHMQNSFYALLKLTAFNSLLVMPTLSALLQLTRIPLV